VATMKPLSPFFSLLPLIYIFSSFSSLVLSQEDICLPHYVIYGVFNDWVLGYISNHTYFSSLPGWTDDTLDPALVVTEEQVNFLNGPSSGLPAHGPYATSKEDFIQKVEKGLQFPYRDYVGEITYSSDTIFADDKSCDRLAYGFTATAQTIKGRYVHFTFYKYPSLSVTAEFQPFLLSLVFISNFIVF
jgi:hypothetical protein